MNDNGSHDPEYKLPIVYGGNDFDHWALRHGFDQIRLMRDTNTPIGEEEFDVFCDTLDFCEEREIMLDVEDDLVSWMYEQIGIYIEDCCFGGV